MALAVTGTHNSRSPYFLSSSVIAFHQHKSLYPSVITFGSSASPLRHKAEVVLTCDLRNGPQALVNASIAMSNSIPWPVSLSSAHSQVITVLQLKYCTHNRHCGFHISLFPGARFFPSCYFFAGFPPFPPQSDLWFCRHPHPLCQKLHNAQSQVFLTLFTDAQNLH